MSLNIKYDKIHLIDGANTPLGVFQIYLPQEGLLNNDVRGFGRVGGVFCTIHNFTKTQVLGLYDHKGMLTVVWGESPSFYDIHVASNAWEAACECAISHVSFNQHTGKYEPVCIDHHDVYTPNDVEQVVGILGLDIIPALLEDK